MRSPRSWVPVAGWLAATLTSIVLASVAMLPVLRTATSGEGGLITADQLRRSGVSDPVALPPAPSLKPSVTPSPPATDDPAPADDPTTETPTRPSPSPSRSRTSSPTKPPPPKPKPTVIDGWTVTTDGDGAKMFVRTFQVEGGTAVVRAQDPKITLVTATPNNGYEVQTVQNTPDNLAVYFNETGHSFIIHVVWNGDAPFAQVDEIGG